MKAEDLEKQLKEFYTTNKDGKGSGFGKRLIEAYARLQIEKDRERIIKECTKFKSHECRYCMADGFDYIEADRNKIKSLPIQLD